jgi:hypothetical protein
VVHLKRHFEVALKVRQAQKWMHRLGYRMTRASHAYPQARSEDPRRFQRALKKLRGLRPDETVVFQDETGCGLPPRFGFGWAPVSARYDWHDTGTARSAFQIASRLPFS